MTFILPIVFLRDLIDNFTQVLSISCYDLVKNLSKILFES